MMGTVLRTPGRKAATRTGLLCLVLAAGFVVAGCRKPAAPDPTASPAPAVDCWFRDVTDEVGLAFRSRRRAARAPTSCRRSSVPAPRCSTSTATAASTSICSKTAARTAPRNQLFHQLPDGRFEDVSNGSGLDVAGYSMGVAVGDVNNDGRPDVLLTQYGGVKLFLNNGDGTFKDVTKEAGLDSLHWGTSACFFDYDRDGWLDLVVVNYVIYDPDRPCGTPAVPPRLLLANPVRRGPPRACTTTAAAGGPVRLRRRDRLLRAGLRARAGTGRLLRRLQRRRLAGHLRRQRRPAQPPVDQPEERHVQGRGGAPRPGLQRLGPGAGGHGSRRGRRQRRRPARPVRDAPDRGNQHPLAAGAGAASSATEPRPSGLADTAERGTGFGTVLGDFDQDGALDLARGQRPGLFGTWNRPTPH